MNEKDLGANAAAVVSAGSIAPDAATARHTPGPWAWFGNTKTHEIHLATERGGRVFVMTFARYGMSSAQPRFQVDRRMVNAHDLVKYERDYRSDIADIDHPDAHLIAAAPELLDALKALLSWSHSEYQSNREIDAQAARAIAKAEGR